MLTHARLATGQWLMYMSVMQPGATRYAPSMLQLVAVGFRDVTYWRWNIDTNTDQSLFPFFPTALSSSSQGLCSRYSSFYSLPRTCKVIQSPGGYFLLVVILPYNPSNLHYISIPSNFYTDITVTSYAITRSSTVAEKPRDAPDNLRNVLTHKNTKSWPRTIRMILWTFYLFLLSIFTSWRNNNVNYIRFLSKQSTSGNKLFLSLSPLPFFPLSPLLSLCFP